MLVSSALKQRIKDVAIGIATLVMLAFAMMAAIRHHANAAPPTKTMRKTRL
jgi:SRSO17 transposase